MALHFILHVSNITIFIDASSFTEYSMPAFLKRVWVNKLRGTKLFLAKGS
jgi:hypothetical protein